MNLSVTHWEFYIHCLAPWITLLKYLHCGFFPQS